MNSDGSRQTRLTRLSSADDIQPDWQPLRKR
jgi:hypothetical protein